MKSLLLICISAYVLICIILYFFQRKLLYFPTPNVTLNSEKNIVFKHKDVKLHGWIINENNDKALIYYGGNAESIEQNIYFFKTVLPEYTIYLINYRGYGKSKGKASQQALFDDAQFIYEQVALEHKKISIMGRSLGSGVATHIASLKNIDKLVLITPYDSVQNVASDIYKIMPVKWLLKDKFESFKNVEKISAKTLIIYGGQDEVIPPKHTQNLISYFPKEQLKTLLIEEAVHNDISMYPVYNPTIKNFLRD